MQRIVLTAFVLAFATAAEAAPIRYELDFDTAFGGTPNERPTLPGEAVSGQGLFEDEFGVQVGLIRNDNANLPVVIFDTDCVGNGCSGGDPDLGTGPAYGSPRQDNILIIQENGPLTNLPLPGGGTVPGVNTPDDDGDGGDIEFTWLNSRYSQGVALDRLFFVDLEETTNNPGNGSIEIPGSPGSFFPIAFTAVYAPGANVPNGTNPVVSEINLLNVNVPAGNTNCGGGTGGGGLCTGDNSVYEIVFDPLAQGNRFIESLDVQYLDVSGGFGGIYFFDAQEIPLPAAAWLLLGGIGALFGLKRIRRAA
ncbi:MAG: VPLPA-CTERM sorting domain-containing protein [Pseudomonadota bacterium]